MTSNGHTRALFPFSSRLFSPPLNTDNMDGKWGRQMGCAPEAAKTAASPSGFSLNPTPKFKNPDFSSLSFSPLPLFSSHLYDTWGREYTYQNEKAHFPPFLRRAILVRYEPSVIFFFSFFFPPLLDGIEKRKRGKGTKRKAARYLAPLFFCRAFFPCLFPEYPLPPPLPSLFSKMHVDVKATRLRFSPPSLLREASMVFGVLSFLPFPL